MAKSRVTVTIDSDTRGFKSGLKEVDAGLSGMSSKLTSTGQAMIGFGSKMTLGVTAPIAAGAYMAFKAASDINESMNKVKVVFGDSAGAIDQWSKQAAKNLGLSRKEALAAAGGFGDMFTQLGFGQDVAAGMSQSVLQMSADLGSFSNLDTADVSDRITAAFRGEFDSLQKVIPNINAARVEKEALALSGKKLAKDLTAQEKAQAVLNIVEKDGAKAKGDFAKTSKDAANASKIAKAQLDDFVASIGKGLLPVGTKLIGFLNKGLEGFNGLSDSTKKFILIGAGIAAAIGPAITVFGALTAGVGFLLSPVGLIIGGIALVAAGFVYLYKTSEPVRESIDGLLNAFKTFDLGNIGESLKGLGSNLSEVLKGGLGALTDAISNIDWGAISVKLIDGLDKLKDAAFDFLGSIDWGGLILKAGELIATGFESLGKLFTNIDWKKVFSFILELGGDLLKLIGKIDWGKVALGIGKGLLGAWKLVFISLPKGLGKMLFGLFSAVFDLIKDVDWGEVAITVGKGLLSLFKLVFGDIPGKIFEFGWKAIKGAWELIKDVDWGEVAGKVGKGFLSLLKTVFIDFPSKAGQTIGKGIKAAFRWAVDNGGDLLGSLTGWLKKIPGKVGDAFKGAGKWLVDTGKDIIQGLIDGAGKLLKKLGSFFLDLVPSWIKTPFKKALGISSPSKVFKEYGRNVVSGLALGISDVKPVAAAMDALTASTSLNLAGSTSSGSTTIINNYYTVEAKMLEPSTEAGRVIEKSLRDFQKDNGR